MAERLLDGNEQTALPFDWRFTTADLDDVSTWADQLNAPRDLLTIC